MFTNLGIIWGPTLRDIWDLFGTLPAEHAESALRSSCEDVGKPSGRSELAEDANYIEMPSRDHPRQSMLETSRRFMNVSEKTWQTFAKNFGHLVVLRVASDNLPRTSTPQGQICSSKGRDSSGCSIEAGCPHLSMDEFGGASSDGQFFQRGLIDGINSKTLNILFSCSMTL